YRSSAEILISVATSHSVGTSPPPSISLSTDSSYLLTHHYGYITFLSTSPSENNSPQQKVATIFIEIYRNIV
ncbi:10298_t:CDS:1, partial [Acaulospora morrowiae]